MSHKYLLLDADGTFLDFERTEKEALGLLFDHFGIDEGLSSSYHKANSRCWEEFENGLITMEELKKRRFDLFFRSQGLDFDAKEASRLYIDELSRHAYYMDGAEEMLSHLSRKHSLSVITNGIAQVQRGRLEALGAMRFFDHVIISEEVGAQKPAKAFFERALALIGARKEDCLVIGDSLTSDIKGAQDAGMDAFHLHLGASASPVDEELWGHGDSFASLLSAVDADQIDVEDQQLVGSDVPAAVAPVGL